MEKLREKAEKMRKSIKKTSLLFTEEEILLMVDAAKKRSDEYTEFMKTHPVVLHEMKKNE